MIESVPPTSSEDRAIAEAAEAAADARATRILLRIGIAAVVVLLVWIAVVVASFAN